MGENSLHQADQALSGEGLGPFHSKPQTPAAMPFSAKGGVCVTTSLRGARGSGCTKVSSTASADGIASVSCSGNMKRKRPVSLLRCTSCCKEAKKGQVRKRLCPRDDSCRRWVHHDELNGFNVQVQHECYKHHEMKTILCLLQVSAVYGLRNESTPHAASAELPLCLFQGTVDHEAHSTSLYITDFVR